MAVEFGFAVLVEDRAEFIAAQQFEGIDAASATAGSVEGEFLVGFGVLKQLGIEIGEDVFEKGFKVARRFA